jgi:hypothetical protein
VSAATNTFRMRARGPFALAAAARFTEAFPAGHGSDGVPRLDLAFPAEGTWTTVAVRITEDVVVGYARPDLPRSARPPGRVILPRVTGEGDVEPQQLAPRSSLWLAA